MDLAIVVYLIGLVNSLGAIISTVLFISIFGFIAYLVFRYANYEYGEDAKERDREVKGYFKKFLFWLILPCTVIITLLPSKTDMYVMTGLVVGEKVLTSEKGNELLDKSYLLLVSKIEKSIENTNEKSSE